MWKATLGKGWRRNRFNYESGRSSFAEGVSSVELVSVYGKMLPWQEETTRFLHITKKCEAKFAYVVLYNDSYNITLFLTAAVFEYMKYITELGFETKPNYFYLRNLFLYGGCQDGNIPMYLFNMKESNENFTCSTFFERPYLRERKPCRPVNGEVKFIKFK